MGAQIGQAIPDEVCTATSTALEMFTIQAVWRLKLSKSLVDLFRL